DGGRLRRRRAGPFISLAAPVPALQRGVEQAEPAREVLLDRQLVLELRLQLELLGVVPFLLSLRDERPEGAALEAVDPVDVRPVAELRLELEGRREQLTAEPRLLQPLRHRVPRRPLALELGVADDYPLVAEVVRLALEPGAVFARHPIEHRLKV